jgi:hypothetical protein
MDNKIYTTARCKPFTYEKMGTYRVAICEDDTVLVYDDVAEHYTACHALSDASQRRIAKKAA